MPFSSIGAYQAHLTPRPTQQLFNDNYLSFDSASGGGTFAQQFLPEIYEKEVERFGKRTISGFLSMVGAEMPLASDQVIWSEQGRLHIAYSAEAYNDGANNVQIADASANTITLPANNLIQNHDTIVVASTDNAKVLKCIVVSGGGTATITVAPYTQAHLDQAPDSGSTNGAVNFADGDDVNIFVYGTEYIKGSSEDSRKIDASFTRFSNKPAILRDRYQVNGSDTAQIGWVEVTSEDGASGYLWYLKSESEARLRFNDYLEMAMIEGQQVEMPAGHTFGGTSNFAVGGTEGLFSALESRGLVWTGTDFDQLSGNVQGGLGEFDTILQELDKQGAIEENMMFLDRGTSLEIDNMLASINSGNVASGGSGYGVFNNDADMALNLGFTGFRRGSYDFYKTDWKYLNDSVTRGLIGDIEGVIVPAGTSTVYDESMGKNIQRPFLHVRYRASEADDRKMKSWITGSVGGNYTSSADEMVVNFLSERCLCVQAANNFVLLKA
jgi:hypothetical protein|tara:strand:- start:57 stop:1547 length:1491 start_codon:yes stop_codon:yes gene_type:complete